MIKKKKQDLYKFDPTDLKKILWGHKIYNICIKIKNSNYMTFKALEVNH